MNNKGELIGHSSTLDNVDIEGKSLPVTANVAILPSEYTLGITGEYERIIKYSKKYLYNPYII